MLILNLVLFLTSEFVFLRYLYKVYLILVRKFLFFKFMNVNKSRCFKLVIDSNIKSCLKKKKKAFCAYLYIMSHP